VVAVLAGVVPIGTLAELVNIGTLFAFALVAIGVLVLRRTDPREARWAGAAGRRPEAAGRVHRTLHGARVRA
jgi:amino acid transporter